MKKFSMALIGSAICLLGTSKAAEAVSFINTSNGQLGTIESSTGLFLPIETGAPAFFDIGIDSQNNFFGITGGESIYRVDLSTNTSSFIGSAGTFINGIGFDGTDVLYGTGGSGLYTIDLFTGAASLVSSISGFSSSGDLAYDPRQDRFFATSNAGNTDQLWSLEKDGTATLIGDVGFNNVYGLLFEDGTLFGYTANRQQISIDLTTGAGNFEGNVSGTTGSIFGAASSISEPTSVPEPTASLIAYGVVLGFGFLKHKLGKKPHSA